MHSFLWTILSKMAPININAIITTMREINLNVYITINNVDM